MPHLPPHLDPREAKHLAQDLLAWRGAPLTLDISSLRRLSAAGAQVMLSAAILWRADGQPLHLTGQSEAFEEAARTLGLGFDAFTSEGNPQ